MKKILVSVKASDVKVGELVYAICKSSTGHRGMFYEDAFAFGSLLKNGHFEVKDSNSMQIYFEPYKFFKELEVPDDVYDMIVSGQSVEDLLNAYELWRSKRKPNGTFGKHIKETVGEYINKK